MIDEKLISKMKDIVKDCKTKGKIVNANDAFDKYAPEGTWSKDKDGNVILKESKNDL